MLIVWLLEQQLTDPSYQSHSNFLNGHYDSFGSYLALIRNFLSTQVNWNHTVYQTAVGDWDGLISSLPESMTDSEISEFAYLSIGHQGFRVYWTNMVITWPHTGERLKAKKDYASQEDKFAAKSKSVFILETKVDVWPLSRHLHGKTQNQHLSLLTKWQVFIRSVSNCPNNPHE